MIKYEQKIVRYKNKWIIKEKYYMKIDRNDVEYGWSSPNDEIEIFINPTSGDIRKILKKYNTKDIRLSIDYNGELYAWDGQVLHNPVQILLNKDFVANFVWTKGNVFLRSNDPFDRNLVKKLFMNSYPFTEGMNKILQLFNNINNIKYNFGLFKIPESF